MSKSLMERIVDRFEERKKRLEANPKSRSDAEAMMILADAGKYAAKAERLRERINSNTRPADLLTDSQRSAVDSLKGLSVAAVAKRLGLTKEYVADYLATI